MNSHLSCVITLCAPWDMLAVSDALNKFPSKQLYNKYLCENMKDIILRCVGMCVSYVCVYLFACTYVQYVCTYTHKCMQKVHIVIMYVSTVQYNLSIKSTLGCQFVSFCGVFPNKEVARHNTVLH